MSWIKGTSSDYIDLSNDVLAAVTATSADSVDSIAAGGSGYVVGDLITLTGGTFTTATVLEVTSVSGGAVTGARIDNAGIYSVAPGDPVAQGSTDGSGTGATFNMTYSSNGWTQDRDQTWSGSDREVIIHGSGGGGDTIYVGWRTYNVSASGLYNWELSGMTGYNSALDIKQQAGASPGDHESGVTVDTRGAYLTLQNSSMNWWLSVTPFRIILVVKVGSSYFPAYLGFINRFATSTEYPYPLLVAGCTSEYDSVHNQSEEMSTLTDPWAGASVDYGPMWLIDTAGTWRGFANAIISGSSLNPANAKFVTLPCGKIADGTSAETKDKFTPYSITYSFAQIINQSALTAPNANLNPTPGSGDDYYVMFPTTLVHSDTINDQQVYGEIDDVFWLSVRGGVVAEDRVIQGDVYRVFPNCNRSQHWGYLAIKEG